MRGDRSGNLLMQARFSHGLPLCRYGIRSRLNDDFSPLDQPTVSGLAWKHFWFPLIIMTDKAMARSLNGLSTRMGATHGRPPSSAESSGRAIASAGSAESSSRYLNSPIFKGR